MMYNSNCKIVTSCVLALFLTCLIMNDIFYYDVSAVTTGDGRALSNVVSGHISLNIDDDGVFTFIAYGDTRSSDETAVSSLHETIVSQYLQYDPEMIIHSGDLVCRGGEAYQWPLFEESISAVRDADIPFYSAVGNHERYTDDWDTIDEDFSTYLDYVDFSDVVDTPGETELHYSFDLQGIHFIFLNTMEEWDGDDYTCPISQMDWLLSDFESNDLEIIIVTFHNPMYSIRADRPERWAQGESLRATFQTLFVDNGVDIVFNGHDHMYYRTACNGIQHIVTGGGGAPLCDFDTDETAYQEGDIAFSDYHYCVCSINNETNQLTMEVFLMDGTTPVDEFSLQLPTQPTQTTFPIEMIVVILGGVAVVIVVLVLIVQKKR